MMDAQSCFHLKKMGIGRFFGRLETTGIARNPPPKAILWMLFVRENGPPVKPLEGPPGFQP